LWFEPEERAAVMNRFTPPFACRATRHRTSLAALAFVCAVLFSHLDQAARRARAASVPGGIMCRPEMALSRRDEIALRLREISGLAELHFDENGRLLLGEKFKGGSATARELLRSATKGEELLILEDASNRADVVFCRIVAARWTHDSFGKPPAQIILIDFEDFNHLIGDQTTRAAFNVGWAVMHELAHAVYDARDGEKRDELGACEELINEMRREAGVAVRVEYFYTALPGLETSDARTNFVRLAFAQTENSKRKIHWLVWDASVIGDLSQKR
jgi:hypothetical protein